MGTIQEQAGKLLPLASGYVGLRAIEIGLHHGLIAAVAKHPGGIGSKDLAAEAGTDPLYTDVWARAAYAAGVLEWDEGPQSYRLGEHMETLLLDAGSPAYIGGLFTALVQPEVFDGLAANLRSGKRIWWSDTSPEWIAAVAGTGGAAYNRLVPGGLERIPGLPARLRHGARLLELASGTGYGVVRLLEHYPSLDVVALDGDQYSIDLARDRIERAGLATKVEFVLSALEDLDREGEFDVVTINLSMHEARDIEKVAAAVHRSLRPGGVFVISDFPFPAHHEGLRTVPGAIMGGIQFFEAQIDDQLLPTAAFVELLERHGFTDVASFDLSPTHAVTHGRRP